MLTAKNTFGGDATARRQVSTGASVWTFDWNPDGGELFYLAGEGSYFVAEIGQRGDAPEPGAPRRLFSLPPSAEVIPAPGGRLLMLRDVDPEGSRASMVVLESWLEEFE